MDKRPNSSNVMRVRRHQPTRLEGFVDSAFAFAVTLIVISIGHVPGSVEDMLQAMRGLPAFAVCFMLIARIWAAHRSWGRHYDIEDGRTLILSLTLVFLVLIYVYPLRLLFSMTFESMSGGWLVDQPVHLRNAEDLRAAYIVFGLGLGAIAIVFILLFRHALKHADEIGLDGNEIMVTRLRMLSWLLTFAISMLSIAITCAIPFDAYSGWLLSVPGCIYLLLMITRPTINRMIANRLTRRAA
jgi:uncharacterized membrane protein